MAKCLRCGKEVETSWSLCQECRTKIRMEMMGEGDTDD